MENVKDRFDRQMCPVCGKPLPFSIVSSKGDTVISAYCRKCKRVSQIRITQK